MSASTNSEHPRDHAHGDHAHGGRGEHGGDLGGKGVPSLADHTVDALLDGRFATGGAPPAYAQVAELLAAATGPPRPDELAGEATALAAFRAARDHREPASADPPALTTAAANDGTASAGTASRRRPGPARPSVTATGRGEQPSGRRRRVRALARSLAVRPFALVTTLLLLGGIGATATAAILAGAGPGRRPGTSVTVMERQPGSPDGTVTPSSNTTRASAPSGNPPGTTVTPPGGGGGRAASAAVERCLAWRAGELHPSGGKAGKQARKEAHEEFKALVKAAGGAGHIDAYCRDILAGEPPQAPDHGQPGKQEQASEQEDAPPGWEPPGHSVAPPAGTRGNGKSSGSQSTGPPSDLPPSAKARSAAPQSTKSQATGSQGAPSAHARGNGGGPKQR